MQKHKCRLCQRVRLSRRVAGGYICEDCTKYIKNYYQDPKIE